MPIRNADNDVGKLTSSTAVLISFGGAAGGFEFAMQLRSDIMLSNNQTMEHGDQSFVYIDAESLKRAKDTTYPFNWQFGMTVMKNPRWKAFYEAAMQQASTMIFLLSKHWLESHWCWGELEWFLTEHSNRAAGNELKPIFVVFPDAAPLLEQGSITLRDGSTQSPTTTWTQIRHLDDATIVEITTAPIPEVETVKWEGHTYTFNFRYACNNAERVQILQAIRPPLPRI